MPFRADVVHILRDFCCFEIAVVLFPDIEQGPAIVAKARPSNVHTPMSHGQPDGPTRLGRYQQGLQALNIGDLAPGGFPVGLRRRLVSPCPTTGRPDASPALLPMAPASGPKPQRPSPQSPNSPSPEEQLNRSPIAFTHTRLRLIRSPGERHLFTPRPAHAKTPTPPI